jgi:YD repeat-containing protein
MQLETVDSAAIHAIGYNPQSRILEIIFTNGGIYRFAGVPAPLYRAMQCATSMGKFFQAHVRGQYPYTRIGRGRVARTVARTAWRPAGRKQARSGHGTRA